MLPAENPPVTLYDVKAAAKIIGVSTNTLYKYLLEGKIKAARGTHRQGRFRIPHSALEQFLGTSIPMPNTSAAPQPTLNIDPLPEPPTNPSYLPILRLLLLLSLVALIADTLLNPSWSLTSGIFRLFSLTLIFLSLYRPWSPHVQ